MTTRNEIRRKKRDVRKLSRTTNGVTNQEQKTALAELEASAEEYKPRDEVVFAALLDAWRTSESRLETLKLTHQRSILLRKKGRQVDPDKLAEQYAQEQQERTLIEEQFAELIEEMEDRSKLRVLLEAAHLVIDKQYFLTVPEELKEKLLAMQAEDSEVLAMESEGPPAAGSVP